jgi:hypothetical protein
MKKLDNIGHPVYVDGQDKITHIIDFEIIDGVRIFYTSDGLCYPENFLTFLQVPIHDDLIKKIIYEKLVGDMNQESHLQLQVNFRKKINELKNNSNHSISWTQKVFYYLSKTKLKVKSYF